MDPEGRLYTWGENDFGQLGLGHLNPRKVPTHVAALEGVKLKSAEITDEHMVVLDQEGQLYSWGRGYLSDPYSLYLQGNFMALGHPDLNDYWLPKKIEFFVGKKVIQFSAGRYSTMAVDDEGNIWSWGHFNISKELEKKYVRSMLPQREETLNELVRASGSRARKVDNTDRIHGILMENGKMFMYGLNMVKQLPVEKTFLQQKEAFQFSPLPVILPGELDVRIADFSIGSNCVLLKHQNGDFYFSGGRMSKGATKLLMAPVEGKIKQFVACDNGAAFLTEDGSVFKVGNFWVGEDENTEFSLIPKRVDPKFFRGLRVREIGGGYSTCFAIVDHPLTTI